MDSRNLQTISFGIILVLAVGLTIFIFLPSLNAVVLALTFAIVSKPLYDVILRVVKNESFASFLTVLVIMVVVVAVPLATVMFMPLPRTPVGYVIVAPPAVIVAALTLESVKAELKPHIP